MGRGEPAATPLQAATRCTKSCPAARSPSTPSQWASPCRESAPFLGPFGSLCKRLSDPFSLRFSLAPANRFSRRSFSIMASIAAVRDLAEAFLRTYSMKITTVAFSVVFNCSLDKSSAERDRNRRVPDFGFDAPFTVFEFDCMSQLFLYCSSVNVSYHCYYLFHSDAEHSAPLL